MASVTEEGLVIRNLEMERTLAFNTTGQPSSIVSTSIKWAAGNRETLAAEAPAWFEFVLNGTPVTALDPVWLFERHTVDEMKHGGIEVNARFRAAEGPVQGLRLVYTVQAYPSTTVFRERLQLEAAEGATFTLNYHDGGVHVIFPRYAFAHPAGAQPETREVRLAGWIDELLDVEGDEPSYEERGRGEGWREGANLGQNYMYHPNRRDLTVSAGEQQRFVGPLLLNRLPQEAYGWILTYEHGTPDRSPEEAFVVLQQEALPGVTVNAVRVQRGAYVDGEPVTAAQPFTTLWSEVALFEGETVDAGEALFWKYLFFWITDEPASREPLVYYNTWGMQRDEQRKSRDVHGVLTLERTLQELALADELGIDLFVLDDGWQQHFGDWRPHPDRFPDGLEPLRRELEQRGIIFGLWMAPMHADLDADIVKQHPDWLIRTETGEPIKARWDRNVFCLTGDYLDYLIETSKRFIDQGVRVFKWDGVDEHYNYDEQTWCELQNQDYGAAQPSREERETRYRYEFVRYITRAIQELKAHNPDVVVEFDATEPGRSIGLAILSEAKYYWMNNGASWYGDRTRFRVKSMRMVPNLYHDLIPPVLQSAANYPHNDPLYHAQRYAVNTSLLGGLGFWGDLTAMSAEDRARVGEEVAIAKRVIDRVAALRPQVFGSVGSSPEIYTYVDPATAEGQVIGFSGAALRYEHRVPANTDNLMAVLRNAYTTDSASVTLPFYFVIPDDTREAFFIPGGDLDAGIVSSTSWLKDARVEGEALTFVNGAPGVHRVRWNAELGEPAVQAPASVRSRVDTGALAYGRYLVEITTTQPDTQVTVTRK